MTDGGNSQIMQQTINRRNFVGQSALAALVWGTADSPFIRVARAGELGANDKIRLGLIGCGGQSQVDLQCFFGNPEIDGAVIADVDEAPLAQGITGRLNCYSNVLH